VKHVARGERVDGRDRRRGDVTAATAVDPEGALRPAPPTGHPRELAANLAPATTRRITTMDDDGLPVQ